MSLLLFLSVLFVGFLMMLCHISFLYDCQIQSCSLCNRNVDHLFMNFRSITVLSIYQNFCSVKVFFLANLQNATHFVGVAYQAAKRIAIVPLYSSSPLSFVRYWKIHTPNSTIQPIWPAALMIVPISAFTIPESRLMMPSRPAMI